MMIKEEDWILLSLYLGNEANKEQSEKILKWCDASSENRMVFEDTQKIMKPLRPIPHFDSHKAFKKLDKKIQLG